MKRQYINFSDAHRLCSEHNQSGEWLYKDKNGDDTLILGTGFNIYLWRAVPDMLIRANGMSKIDLYTLIEGGD